MPCNSDYMDPTVRESNSREVAILLVYVSGALEINCDPRVVQAANHLYGNTDLLDQMTADLCTLCNGLSEEEADKVIYDGRNYQARRLANWWDAHQEADRKRLEKEDAERRQKLAKEAVLAKLSPEDREILGL